jgi:hypothetical protein
MCIKLVIKISLYYDVPSEKHQILFYVSSYVASGRSSIDGKVTRLEAGQTRVEIPVRNFSHLQTPALGTNQPLLQWVTEFLLRTKRPERDANH